MGDLFKLAGFDLASNPRTQDPKIDPLLVGVNYFGVKSRKHYVIDVIPKPVEGEKVDYNSESWDALIREALSKPLAAGDMTIRTVLLATRKEIQDALLGKKPDIVQFIGHGVYKKDKGYIALMDDLIDSVELDEQEFANLFQGFDDNLGLISLTACESAESSNPQGFRGIGPHLVERGVPAVAHKPVDWATQMARNAVSIEFSLGDRAFATPVLYMRAKDGNNFN